MIYLVLTLALLLVVFTAITGTIYFFLKVPSMSFFCWAMMVLTIVSIVLAFGGG